MDPTFQIFLFIHLVAFAVGAATNVAMPIVAGQLAGAGPETAPRFGAIAKRLSNNARAAVVILIISGVGLVYLRYGGFEGMNAWFWVKMALVAFIVVMMGVGAFLPQLLNPKVFGPVMRVTLLGIVLAAVFAFN